MKKSFFICLAAWLLFRTGACAFMGFQQGTVETEAVWQ